MGPPPTHADRSAIDPAAKNRIDHGVPDLGQADGDPCEPGRQTGDLGKIIEEKESGWRRAEADAAGTQSVAEPPQKSGMGAGQCCAVLRGRRRAKGRVLGHVNIA